MSLTKSAVFCRIFRVVDNANKPNTVVGTWWTVKSGSKTGLFTQAGGQMLDYGNFAFSLLKLT